MRLRPRRVGPLAALALLAPTLTTTTAQAASEIVTDCPYWVGTTLDTPLPATLLLSYTAVGANDVQVNGLMSASEGNAGDEVHNFRTGLDNLRLNGLTTPYSITVHDPRDGTELASGSVSECPGTKIMTPAPEYPASSGGRWSSNLPSNEYISWRYDRDDSLTIVANPPHSFRIYTRDALVEGLRQEYDLGMPPGSEEQVRFDNFYCASWGGDDDGLWVWASAPGVEDYVRLQQAHGNGDWVDITGTVGYPPDGRHHARPTPWRFPLPNSVAYPLPTDAPLSLRALSPEGRVVGQRTYDRVCGVDLDPMSPTVVALPSPMVDEAGDWVVPADDATHQWFLELDGDLVVRVLPSAHTFPDGEVTHNFGLPTVDPAPAPDVTRSFGADRFATAATVATSNYAPGLSTVYLATGWDFPDALAAAAVAGSEEAPVLLTGTDSLPDVTRAALVALTPAEVVLLGGPAAVTEKVVDQVAALGLGVIRVSGDDRYATAAKVSARLAPSDTVFVASGHDHADALAAGALAGSTASPVLLTRVTMLPEATVTELRRHSPSTVYLLGGTAAVSTVVEEQITDLGLDVVRVSGKDRYATAAAVAALHGATGFPDAWVTSGVDFADALAGAPLAAREDGVVLLTRPRSLPEVTAEALVSGGPARVTVLGGEAAVSGAVEEAIKALPWE